jgi:hypothetical protein
MVMAAPRSPRLLCFPVPASSFTLARQRQRRRPELHGEATAARSSGSSGAGCSGRPFLLPLHRGICLLSIARPLLARATEDVWWAGACFRRLSIPPDTKELGTDDIFPGGIPSPAAGCISWKVQRDMMKECLPSPSAGGLTKKQVFTQRPYNGGGKMENG